MKIAVYGGTFNPLHLGHLTAAQAAFSLLQADRLLLIPTKTPPHKPLAEGSPTEEQRLEMLRLAAEPLGERVQVLDCEMQRDGKSYTSDTLRELKKQYPEDDIWVMMGTDMFLTFQCWHEPKEILEMAGIVGFGRSEADTEELFAVQREYLRKSYPQSRVETVVLPNIVEISSTALRESLQKGEGGKYLPPAVYGYILRHQLYGVTADLHSLPLAELRAVALSFLRSKRIPHVLGTEKTASILAERYGANVEDARIAALLHDCTKKVDEEGQFALCRQYGLPEGEACYAKLLHAKTGAEVAKAVCGVNEAVYEAIRWHTTGKPDMNLLEKIIYLADYIEPNRDFKEVAEMRALCETDLDLALRMGLRLTIEDTQKRGNAVHQDTIDALKWVEAICREKERNSFCD